MALFVARKGKRKTQSGLHSNEKQPCYANPTNRKAGKGDESQTPRDAQGTPMLEGSREGVVTVFSLTDLGHTPFHLLVVPLCLSDCLGWGGSERQLVRRQASSLGSSHLVTKPPFCHPSRSQENGGRRRQNQPKDAA